MHQHDRMHEGQRINKVTNASNTLFNLVRLILVGPISTDLQPCALPPGGKPVPSAALPTWSPQLKAKYALHAKSTTSSYHQWHHVRGSLGRGEAEMKCSSHRRCVQLAMFFHSAGGTANLFSSTIYGSKQDANSGIEVVCHMQVGNLVVLTKSFSQDHKFRVNISPSSSGKLKWRTLNLSLNHKLLPLHPSIHPSDRQEAEYKMCTYKLVDSMYLLQVQGAS